MYFKMGADKGDVNSFEMTISVLYNDNLSISIELFNERLFIYRNGQIKVKYESAFRKKKYGSYENSHTFIKGIKKY